MATRYYSWSVNGPTDVGPHGLGPDLDDDPGANYSRCSEALREARRAARRLLAAGVPGPLAAVVWDHGPTVDPRCDSGLCTAVIRDIEWVEG